jgi:1,4-alpha-glucan branching enzyme
MKKLFLLSVLLLAVRTHADLSSFYTDDSEYFQKVYKDGFSIRFSVDRKDCQKIKKAEILLKVGDNSVTHPMAKASSTQKNWPDLYQIDESELCWFEGRVKGIDHNNENLYSLKLALNGKTLYFNEVSDSLIPHKRLKGQVENWLTPGAVGASPVIGGGTLFKIWEPESERVDITINQKKTHQLNTPLTNEKLHYLYLPDASAGDEYAYHFVKNGKYEVLEVGNNKLMSSIKVDPMAKRVTYDQKGGSINGYKNPRAIVTAPSRYVWKNDQNIQTLFKSDIQSWLIYQLWPLTFNPQKKKGKYQGGTFKDIEEKISYLKGLGITAVEFLPIHESRFHASWGYALDSLALIENNYGTPNELRALVDKFHQNDLKIVFDVVINHVNNSLIRDPLSKNRFNTKFYRGNTPWGPKPDFNNPMVRKWIADSLVNLVRDYHVDGLRFDMIETVYIGSKTGYQFVQELNALLKMSQPKIYLSAEQLPDNAWATFPISQNGLGFDSQWNDKFKNFFELKFDHYTEFQRGMDYSPIIGSLLGYSNHDSGNGEYHFGGASRTLNYLGSHDFVGNKNPLMRIISSFESYESSGENYFFRVRPLEIPDAQERHDKFRLIHTEFNHNTSLTSYGLLFTKPGASMFFQGEEMASDLNIENEWSYINAKENNSVPTIDVDIHRYVGSHRVPWEYLTPMTSPELSFLNTDEKESFKRYHEFFKTMVKFRKDHPEVDLNDAQDVKECLQGVLCYRLERGPKELFVVINYGFPIKSSWLKFPGTGTDYWQEVISLAHEKYSSGNKKYLNIISNVGGRSNNVRLAGPSISVFSKKRSAEISDVLYFRSNANSWSATDANKLQRASDRGDIYMTKITITQPMDLEFKLGTADWQIELGSPKNGELSYIPNQGNAKAILAPGQYHFLFNIKDFKYQFLKVKDL